MGRHKLNRTPTKEELLAWLAARTSPDGACWIWLRAKSNTGYPQASFMGISGPVTRLVVNIMHGPIPEGHQVDHICRVPACVNPAHLEAVTREENLRRAGRTLRPARQTPKDHGAVALAKLRWKGTSRAERVAHSRRMHAAREAKIQKALQDGTIIAIDKR